MSPERSRFLRGLAACLGGLIAPLMAQTVSPALPAAAAPPLQLATVHASRGFDSTAIEAWIQQPRFAHARWGIAVAALDSGQLLYGHQAVQLLQTASTAKLFTAATVLDQPGPAYRIPTRVLGGPISASGRMTGPLVLYGMGDPTLGTPGGVSDWAQQLAAQLAQRGLRQIQGDLIADDSYFSGPDYGAGWEAEDLQTWYGAPTSALSVNENITELSVEAANRIGRPAGLVLTPPKAIARIDSQLLTGPAREGSAINLYRAPGSQSLQVFGQIALRSPARHYRLALPEPARTAGLLLADALRARGIRLLGRVSLRHWPAPPPPGPARSVLAEVDSPPLLQILQQGLKRSQNLYLQNLLQIAGVGWAAAHPPAQAGDFRSSADAGIAAAQALLARIGIDPAQVNLSDGTGMSRRSLASPLALVQLLVYMAHQSDAADFRAGLPLAGVDGTLAHQFRASAAAGNLQAKTGSMSLVHCLAGYVTTLQGTRLAFAIMLNNYVPPAGAPSISHDVDQVALLLTRDGAPEPADHRDGEASVAAD